MRITKAEIKRVRRLKQRKFRDEEHLFVAEGRKCVSSLFERFTHGFVIIREGSEHLSVPKDMRLLEASASEMEQLSQLQTPSDVIGVFEMPSEEISTEDILNLSKKELILLLDEIQDPGNLGTIIRTADWFGVHHIVCSPTSADVYNPKTVQATMGSIARVRVSYTGLPELLRSANQQAIPVYGTLLQGENIYSSTLSPAGLLIMGNEGRGISHELQHFLTSSLFIPSYPPDAPTAESLNVSIATAIVLAEFRRRTY